MPVILIWGAGEPLIETANIPLNETILDCLLFSPNPAVLY